MKKLFAVLLVSLFALTSVVAQETEESGKKITITVDDESFSPKIFWLTDSGRGKLLGNGAGEYLVPEGSGIVVTKYGQKLNWDDFASGDEIQIVKGNPGLNGLGVSMTIIGSICTGFGLGFGLIGLMEGDSSVMGPALGTLIPGACVLAGGFALNYNFRPKLRKL